jgi:fatty acid desaturase
MKPRHWIEIPVRSILLPHVWLLWLLRRGLLRRGNAIEYVAHYALMGAIYGTLGWLVGPARVALGLFPALAVLSIVLWYPFAIKTHEGYSTGSQEARSHGYYGSWIYWLTLGLSMHRVHHLRPDLAWMEIAPAARNQGGSFLDRLLMRREIRS